MDKYKTVVFLAVYVKIKSAIPKWCNFQRITTRSNLEMRTNIRVEKKKLRTDCFFRVNLNYMPHLPTEMSKP